MPTIVEETIGGSSPVHLNTAAWELDSGVDLVSLDERRIGQLQVKESASDWLIIHGETADVTRYRELTFGGDGARYDPIADTGSGRTSSNTVVGTQTGNGAFLRLTGILIECTGVSGVALFNDGAKVLLDGCTVRNTVSDTCLQIFEPIEMRNGLILNTFDGNLTSIGNSDVQFYDCVFWSSGGGNKGFRLTQDDTVDTAVKNCTSFGFGATECFKFDGVSSNGDYENNISEDNSAPGGDSHINETDTDVHTDPTNDDFTLVESGVAVEGGVDLSGIFTTDITGATRDSTWDIGAYDHSLSAINPFQIVIT